MNASPMLPPHFRWTPQQLTNAVPPRLSELFAFDARLDGTAGAANEPRQRLRIAHGYRGDSAPAPRFRIS